MKARADQDEAARRVDALKRSLKSALSPPMRQSMRRTIEDGLHTAKAEGLKAGQYLAQIGRILGM